MTITQDQPRVRSGFGRGRFTFKSRTADTLDALATGGAMAEAEATELAGHFLNQLTWAAENAHPRVALTVEEAAASRGMALASAELAVSILDPSLDRREAVRVAHDTFRAESAKPYIGNAHGYRSAGMTLEQRRTLVEHFAGRADESARRAQTDTDPVKRELYAAAASTYRGGVRLLAEPHIRDALLIIDADEPMGPAVHALHTDDTERN